MIKTHTFRTVLTNVLDCEIGVSETAEAASIGTLSQVAASVSDGPSLAEYAAIQATELTKYKPDPTRFKIYENLYTEWRHKKRLLLSYEL